MARIGGFVLGVFALMVVFNIWPMVFVPSPSQQFARHARMTVPVSAGISTAAGLGAMQAWASPLDDAAKKLARVSYPMAKAYDWKGHQQLNEYMSHGFAADKTAIRAVLQLGSALDPALVRTAVEAHKNAVDAVDGNLVTPAKNFEEVIVAVAHMLASAPPEKIYAVMAAAPQRELLMSNMFNSMPDKEIGNQAFDAFLDLSEIIKG